MTFKRSQFLLAVPLLSLVFACGKPAGAEHTVDGALTPKKPGSKASLKPSPVIDNKLVTPSKTRDTKLIAAVFAEAEKAGLVIKGLKDQKGFTRVIESHIKATPAFHDSLFDKGLAKELGIGKELAEFAAIGDMLNNLDVYRVELIPGFDKYDRLGDPLVGDPGGKTGSSHGSDFFPGFPSKGSLVGHMTSRQDVRTPNGHIRVTTYSDGSSYTQATVDHGNGRVTNTVETTNADGSSRWSWMQHVDKRTGTVIAEDERWGDTSAPSEAGSENDRHGSGSGSGDSGGSNDGNDSSSPNDSGANDSGGGDDGGAEDDGGVPPNPYIDQYQPADAGGTFCPLSVEICRRGLAKALASGASVSVGIALVNPGEPDDQPEASRLVYDPKDLVINPAAAESVGGGAPPQMRLELPVWVLPPGPSDL